MPLASQDTFQSDPIISNDRCSVPSTSCSPAERTVRKHITQAGPSMENQGPSELDALLGSGERRKKPFYRPRPLWIVPFAVAASIARGMTLAPRVEVFTQLSCDNVYGRHPIDYNHSTTSNYAHLYDPLLLPMDPGDLDPMHVPSKQCISDPVVQSGAARLQTIMTTVMGALSALTTGWWGQFGEKYGRTRVLAASTLGLLLTDLTFILVSTPHSIFSTHGHKLLILAPIIEGALGGWSTLQGATSAYISDCTSDGSRAHIFSRFTGVFYLGFALGPIFGAFLISHSPSFPFIPATHGKTVTPVFWVAMLCSVVNLLLAFFLFPESLSLEKQAVRRAALSEARKKRANAGDGSNGGVSGLLAGWLRPMMVFAPKMRGPPGSAKRKDWSLTFLAIALFAYMLSMGVFQIKYLYAEHVYGWGAEQLSYYISFVGGARALHLLFVLPLIITSFKPRPTQTATTAPSTSGKKPKPTRAQLAAEMSFDLTLTRLSFLTDMLSHTLVSLSSTIATPASQASFVGFTVISSFASGVVPNIQSLAMCILHADENDREGEGGETEKAGAGSLFGAFAVLQAVGQMILGPMLFGLVYSSTVAKHPKAIFTLAAAICMSGFAFLSLVRPTALGAKHTRRRRAEVEVERGRSRVSKDLTGGAWRPEHPGYGAAGYRNDSDSGHQHADENATHAVNAS